MQALLSHFLDGVSRVFAPSGLLELPSYPPHPISFSSILLPRLWCL